jgi:hypothetical protein
MERMYQPSLPPLQPTGTALGGATEMVQVEVKLKTRVRTLPLTSDVASKER